MRDNIGLLLISSCKLNVTITNWQNERSQNTVLLASVHKHIYKSPHSTVWECILPGTSAEYGSTVGSLRVTRLKQVAHRFGSDKLYISLSNKCFKVYPVYSLCTDVRPSQDHRILRMQMVRINLAKLAQFWCTVMDYSSIPPSILSDIDIEHLNTSTNPVLVTILNMFKRDLW